MPKSTVEQIRERFDKDVERFSNLETGQSATIDAPLALDLVARAAAATTPHAKRSLDIGCGAGNFTLKLLETLPWLETTLVDLSQPMLARAEQRVRAAGAKSVTVHQGDVRQLDLGRETADVIVAGAVLHHLRTDDEWRRVYRQLYNALAPGGSLWVFDLVESDQPAVQQMMWQAYGDYLAGLGGPDYRDKVFAYVEQEDTPRSVVFQLDCMRAAGFTQLDILHKRVCFAAFGGVKPI